jgi:hypothetical protein
MDTQLTRRQESMIKKLKNPFLFRLFTFFKIPAARRAGLKLISLNVNSCKTSIPFKFFNKNPFKSIYFAIQSMAAEFSTATLALLELERHKESVAFIVVDLEATFHKKADGLTFFECTEGEEFRKKIELAIETGVSQEVRAKTVGSLADGTVVSTFYFTWSFKVRKK